MATTTFYQPVGTLPYDAPSDLERQADRDLYEALRRGEFHPLRGYPHPHRPSGGQVVAVAPSPDDAALATGRADGTIRLWSVDPLPSSDAGHSAGPPGH